MSEERIERLIEDGKPVSHIGRRVLIVERRNRITGEEEWYVECPEAHIRLPAAASRSKAITLWRTLAAVSLLYGVLLPISVVCASEYESTGQDVLRQAAYQVTQMEPRLRQINRETEQRLEQTYRRQSDEQTALDQVLYQDRMLDIEQQRNELMEDMHE